jgi:DNA-binding transcriptional LysR family regulator
MDLKDIDLNLLVVFNQLLLEKRVSAVAASLGQTQPGISNALNRLRKLLGDDLFLRTSRGMEPTPLAAQLAEPISQALQAIHSTLNQRTIFDPLLSTRKFTIAITDIGEIYFLPRLLDALANAAPHVTINTVRNAAVNLRDELEAGNVDLAIGLLPQLKAGFFQRRLFEQKYVCLYRAGHALDKKTMSIKEFEAAEHVAVVSPETGHVRVDESIRRKGIHPHVRLTVPHFVALGHILSNSDMIATVPERYALQCVEPFNLKFVAHPVALPETGINLFWSAKYHKEAGNQWLRGLIFDLFSDPERAVAA